MTEPRYDVIAIGNAIVDVMAPASDELIEEFGADAVRFTLTAMAAMGRDLKLSTQRIAGYRNFGTKLWNATRFAEMNDAITAKTGGERPDATQTVNKTLEDNLSITDFDTPFVLPRRNWQREK